MRECKSRCACESMYVVCVRERERVSVCVCVPFDANSRSFQAVWPKIIFSTFEDCLVFTNRRTSKEKNLSREFGQIKKFFYFDKIQKSEKN